jgi:hypothetical protein
VWGEGTQEKSSEWLFKTRLSEYWLPKGEFGVDSSRRDDEWARGWRLGGVIECRGSPHEMDTRKGKVAKLVSIPPSWSSGPRLCSFY